MAHSKYFIHRQYKDTKLSDGKIVTVHVYSREGLKSPDTWYYEYQGRLISPFEQRIRNWANVPINFIFKRVYGHLLEELLPQQSLLSKIKKDNNWKGGNYVIPFGRK